MSSGLSSTSKMLEFSTILSFLTDFWNADNFSLCQPPQVSIDTAIRNAQDMRHNLICSFMADRQSVRAAPTYISVVKQRQ